MFSIIHVFNVNSRGNKLISSVCNFHFSSDFKRSQMTRLISDDFKLNFRFEISLFPLWLVSSMLARSVWNARGGLENESRECNNKKVEKYIQKYRISAVETKHFSKNKLCPVDIYQTKLYILFKILVNILILIIERFLQFLLFQWWFSMHNFQKW